MAVNNTEKSYSKMEFPLAMQRQDAFALDPTEIWPSLEAAQTYANIVAVKEGHENDPAIVALVDALHSDTIKDFINSNYNGSVLPID